MTRTLRYLLLIALIGTSASTFAQEIGGKVLDENKEGMINAVVQVMQGGTVKGGTITDFDGNFVIKPLDPGYYDVIVLYSGYDTLKSREVLVRPDTRTTLNFTMHKPVGHQMKEFVVTWEPPLVDHDTKEKILTKADIDVMPTTLVEDMVSTSTNAYQAQRGGAVQLSGSRVEGTTYIIDGVVVQGQTGVEMAQGSIEQLDVITSGVPANYGDFSGGVVNITSRSVTQKLTGDVRVQHSVDGYNNNLVTFSISGPLYKKFMGEGKPKKPLIGFTLSGDVYDDNDRYPYYEKQWVATPAETQYLQNNPLTIGTNNTGTPVYNNSSDYITYADMEQVKAPKNNTINEYRMNGKLDYQVTNDIRLIGGASIDYTSQDLFNRAAMVFATSAIPVQNTFVGRGYLRFTQKFGKPGDTSTRNNIISNAYYKIQADYQKTYGEDWDPRFKNNYFDYAYVGKFQDGARTNVYLENGLDSLSGKEGTVLQFSTPGAITYYADPTGMNPLLQNYTKELYNSFTSPNLYPTSMSQIQNDNGITNGDEPLYTYGLFYSPGATQSAYSISNINQYSLDVSTNFDLLLGKVKHSIELGLYYQQRIESSFVGLPNPNGSGTQSIWQLMRQLVSTIDNGGLVLDKSHPIFKINGQYYNYVSTGTGTGYFTDQNGNIKNVNPNASDTILYNYANINPTVFDQNLRKELNVADNANINIDAYTPNYFSLNMFSADELLNEGNKFVSYDGYTYTGQLQQGNVNFNDFWTAKNAQGNYTRPIAPFEPNYTAGYILDKFTYKDLHFNIGIRVDRFDYNSKVLTDPYSLYQEETVSEIPGSDNIINGGHHPANMGSNYVVYVEDNTAAQPVVIGYRNGNNWFSPTGQLVTDPSVLSQYNGGNAPQPALVKNAAGTIPNITDSNFNPNNSFTNYTPQVVVEPRIQFSFPVSDVADFYAHYDIYAQRPTGNIEADPTTYYFLQNNANQIINNPNLKPQLTYDYEAGFQQKLSDRSALTLTAFYKERKDFIQVTPYLYAWPTTYYSYANTDFTTTKGTSLYYDLRATNHLTMKIAYTLQFADGTGSTPYSTNSGGGGQISPNGLLQQFIEAGEPNERYVVPLDYDSRHNITADMDYRYKTDEGPIVSGQHILQNAGIHLIAKARSGEPYTKFEDALGTTVIGGVNGARLPWHYGMDLRIDKDFAVNNLRRQKNAPEGIKPKRPLFVRAIFQVNNLLNTRDVLGVYGFTGKPNDNGYLASPYGQQFVPQQINPTSYTDLYQINVDNPNNLNWARTMSVALEFNF